VRLSQALTKTYIQEFIKEFKQLKLDSTVYQTPQHSDSEQSEKDITVQTDVVKTNEMVTHTATDSDHSDSDDDLIVTQTDALSDIQTIKEDNTKRVAERSHGDIETDCTHSLEELSGN